MRKYPTTVFVFLVFFAAGVRPDAQAIGASITCTWADTSQNEVGFGVERKHLTTGLFEEIARTAVNVTTYTDAGLPDGQVRCYRIFVYDATGRGVASPEDCGTARDDSIPAAPSNLTVSP